MTIEHDPAEDSREADDDDATRVPRLRSDFPKAHGSGEGEPETQIAAYQLGPERGARVGRPQVTWSDFAGSHTVSIDSSRVVGSSPRANIVVRDRMVSRMHAAFEPREDGLWVRDLNSRNGTYVEGVLVSCARVPDGGKVRLGAFELSVCYGPEAEPPELWPTDRCGPMVGASRTMRELFARIARMAVSDASVLIQGETGTGKELAARAIHDASPRRAQPFAIVDCAALPEALLESELFGHVRGAFTGAVAARAGAIAAADGGTVFLDEIGELPLAMQPKLLRVMESRTVRRIGENDARKVDVRFVSATNRDIQVMVNAGSFREDLYFRLAVLPLTIPPLRERPDDIPALIQAFLPETASGSINPELLRELVRRPWWGNVRELRNFVARAHALGAHEALEIAQRDPAQNRGARVEGRAQVPLAMDRPLREARVAWQELLEREYVARLLDVHHRNISRAAEFAGVDRTYLHRLIRKHGL